MREFVKVESKISVSDGMKAVETESELLIWISTEKRCHSIVELFEVIDDPDDD